MPTPPRIRAWPGVGRGGVVDFGHGPPRRQAAAATPFGFDRSRASAGDLIERGSVNAACPAPAGRAQTRRRSSRPTHDPRRGACACWPSWWRPTWRRLDVVPGAAAPCAAAVGFGAVPAVPAQAAGEGRLSYAALVRQRAGGVAGVDLRLSRTPWPSPSSPARCPRRCAEHVAARDASRGARRGQFLEEGGEFIVAGFGESSRGWAPDLVMPGCPCVLMIAGQHEIWTGLRSLQSAVDRPSTGSRACRYGDAQLVGDLAPVAAGAGGR